MRIHLKEWAAVSRPEYRRMATDARHLLSYRVHFAALGMANQTGHAELGPGELAEILVTPDGTPQTKQGVSRAIREAKALNLIGPESRARCLVLPSYLYATAKGSAMCATHGVRLEGT